MNGHGSFSHLPVELCPGDPLLGEGSLPIWPVNTSELPHLRATAASWGFQLHLVEPGSPKLVQPSACEADPGPGDGVVVSVGIGSASQGRLYAHLTGRPWHHVANLESLPDPDDVAVVLGIDLPLTSTFLDHLYDPQRHRAVGLIVAQSQAQLRLLVRCRAAVMRMGGDRKHVRIDIVPHSRLNPAHEGRTIALGSGSPPLDVRAALRTGNAVTTIFTHSDGLDADLGPGAVLCPVDGLWTQAGPDREPTCRRTQYCYRAGAPIPEVTYQLVHPAQLSARVLILNTCVGITPVDSNIDRKFGLGARLLGNADIGALITSWRPTLGNYLTSLPVARFTLSGQTLGAAVAASNQIHDELGTGMRFCLAGDPATRAVPQGSQPLPDPQPAPNSDHYPTRSEASISGELSLLATCLAAVGQSRAGSIPDMAGSSETVDRAQEAINAVLADPSDIRAAAILRDCSASVFAQRGRLNDTWLGLATSYRATLMARCRHCSNSVVRYLIALSLPGVSDRELELCPRCGFVRDQPAGCALDIDVTDGGLVCLSGLPDLPDSRSWAGQLGVRYRDPLPAHQQKWPADPDGLPARRVQVDRDLVDLPVSISVTFVLGDRLIQSSRTLVGGSRVVNT